MIVKGKKHERIVGALAVAPYTLKPFGDAALVTWGDLMALNFYPAFPEDPPAFNVQRLLEKALQCQ